MFNKVLSVIAVACIATISASLIAGGCCSRPCEPTKCETTCVDASKCPCMKPKPKPQVIVQPDQKIVMVAPEELCDMVAKTIATRDNVCPIYYTKKDLECCHDICSMICTKGDNNIVVVCTSGENVRSDMDMVSMLSAHIPAERMLVVMKECATQECTCNAMVYAIDRYSAESLCDVLNCIQ